MISYQIGRCSYRFLFPFALLFASTAVSAEETQTEPTPLSPATGIGTDPSMPTHTGSNSTTGEPPMTVRTSTKDWEFGFHGFMRAPLVFSFDNYAVERYQYDDDGNVIMTDDDNPVPDLKDTGDRDWRFKMPGTTADGAYNSWAYTNNMPGPWAELLFSYGNKVATAYVTLASWNITDSGYRNFNAQLGINQAWLSLKFDRAFRKLGGLKLNAGVFDNRYGQAGRYDAGRYDTYIFGRTHIAGETLTANFNFTDNISLFIEHGFGAKTGVMGGDTRSLIHSGWKLFGDNTLDWTPYNGDVVEYNGRAQFDEPIQYPAFVNHAHAGLLLRKFALWDELWINGHFMHSFTNSTDQSDSSTTADIPRHREGKVMVAGGEVKANGAVFGDTYLGFSAAMTDGMAGMPDSIELLHSVGGWNFNQNFYGGQTLTTTPDGDASRDGNPNPGTGRVYTLAWQYSLSLAKLLWHLQGQRFYGQGPDLVLSFFGMFNSVHPDKDLKPYLNRWAKKKLKLGGEAMWTPIKYLGIGLRVDHVAPDTSYDKAQTTLNDSTPMSYAPFTVLTPMIRIRTAFLTREEFNISYARYFWSGDREEVRSPQRFAEVADLSGSPVNADADRNAVMLSVNMWW